MHHYVHLDVLDKKLHDLGLVAVLLGDLDDGSLGLIEGEGLLAGSAADLHDHLLEGNHDLALEPLGVGIHGRIAVFFHVGKLGSRERATFFDAGEDSLGLVEGDLVLVLLAWAEVRTGEDTGHPLDDTLEIINPVFEKGHTKLEIVAFLGHFRTS